jgi:hypothetical protein
MARRSVLGLAGAGVGGLVLYGATDGWAGTTAAVKEPEPAPHHDVNAINPADFTPPAFSANAAGACGSTVFAQSEIAAQPTYYEVSGKTATFSYNSTFYSRLETWLEFFYNNSPVPWTRPGQIWTYGAYLNRNDGCVSHHNTGRAFDISRVYCKDPATGDLVKRFNARYDQWKSTTGSTLTTTRKNYWATAASLNYHFKYVLTYLYNADHSNHIHVDNSQSGSGNSTFTTGTKSQVQCVQAQANYVWGANLTIDGDYGPKSIAAVNSILARIGRSGSLTTQANWLEFNKATMRFGSGAQTY